MIRLSKFRRLNLKVIKTSWGFDCQTYLKDTSKENLESLKKRLNPVQYEVCVERGTERAYTGMYDSHFQKGEYTCKVCSNPLFTSKDKFNSGCGWPAFSKGENLHEKRDMSHGMIRVEVLCNNCGSHLGHVFEDGPKEMGGLRYCINSASIDFKNTDS